jgi:3-dehydroquinate synthetase
VAVAVGILAEAEAHGAPAAVLDTVRRLLRHVGLPDAVAVPWDDTVAHALLVRDKKRRGQEILCPVLESPGRVSIRVTETGRLLHASRAVIEG